MSHLVCTPRNTEAIIDGFESDWEEIPIPSATGSNGAGTVAMKLFGWCVTSQNEEGEWIDFYSVTLNAELQYGLDDPLHIDGYQVSCQPVDEFGKVVRAVKLIDCSPAMSSEHVRREANLLHAFANPIDCYADKIHGLLFPTDQSPETIRREIAETPSQKRQQIPLDNAAEWYYDFGRALDSRTVRLDISHQILFQTPHAQAPDGVLLRTEMRLDFSGHLAREHTRNRDLFFVFSAGNTYADGGSRQARGKYRSGRIDLNPHFCRLKAPELPLSER